MKLNKEEKKLRKLYKAELPKGSYMQSFGRLTVLMVPSCRGNGHVTWAIAAKGEPFNRKRGEFVALRRWHDGCAMPIECFPDNEEMAGAIGCTLCDFLGM